MDTDRADTAAPPVPLPASGAAGPARALGGAEAAMDEPPANAADIATDCSTAGVLLSACLPRACMGERFEHRELAASPAFFSCLPS